MAAKKKEVADETPTTEVDRQLPETDDTRRKEIRYRYVRYTPYDLGVRRSDRYTILPWNIILAILIVAFLILYRVLSG